MHQESLCVRPTRRAASANPSCGIFVFRADTSLPGEGAGLVYRSSARCYLQARAPVPVVVGEYSGWVLQGRRGLLGFIVRR